MYIFRDGKYEATGAELISCLQTALGDARRAPNHPSNAECEDRLLAALIAAGELECALLDSRADDSLLDASCSIASLITEGLARAFLTGRKDSFPSVLQLIERIEAGARYQAAVQEGFAYYALHPRKLATLLEQMLVDGALPGAGERSVRVLGIRSIGVTLSAVACATLGLHGIDCRRISVRPEGHPYDRRLRSSQRLCHWVRSAADAEFLVVDEGPGISGSSFLAVAEALESCGVAAGRIHLIGSREVDAAELLACDAARRWSRFNIHTIPAEPLIPREAGENFSGRARWSFFGCPPESEPGSWTTLGPAAYLAQDRQSTFTFAGFGHYGEAIGERCRALGEAGFAPRYLGSRRGFVQSELPAGRLLSPGDVSPKLISRLAAYLAFRANAFAVPVAQTPELEVMLRRNWQIEFDEELGVAESRLSAKEIVICDGRMRAHEWLRSSRGEVLKLYSGNDGDNHFFPGPCDIAWDVAGCILEWELEPEAQRRLIDEYTARTGDAIAARLAPYLLAYAVFCMARAKMGSCSSQSQDDAEALARDYRRYRALALRLRTAQEESSEESSESDPEPLGRAS
jgi:hypothetical protein